MEGFWYGGEAMGAERPPSPGDDRAEQRVKRAAWSAGAGATLGAAAGVGAALRVISPQQAIAIGTPAAVLLAGGLVVIALSEPAIGLRRGSEAGFLVGVLLGRRRRGRDGRGGSDQRDGSAQPDNHGLAWAR